MVNGTDLLESIQRHQNAISQSGQTDKIYCVLSKTNTASIDNVANAVFYCDAQGNWTIRVADSTLHEQTVATAQRLFERLKQKYFRLYVVSEQGSVYVDKTIRLATITDSPAMVALCWIVALGSIACAFAYWRISRTNKTNRITVNCNGMGCGDCDACN